MLPTLGVIPWKVNPLGVSPPPLPFIGFVQTNVDKYQNKVKTLKYLFCSYLSSFGGFRFLAVTRKGVNLSCFETPNLLPRHSGIAFSFAM